MTLIKFTVLTILILWSSLSNAQFTIKELQSIRVSQLKAIACDSLFINRESKIASQDQQIRNYKLTIKTFSEKEEMYLSERSYYLDQIRDRNKTIESFEKKRKLARIGLVALTGISGLLFGYVMLSK